jgi:hypothetical protein
MWRQALQLILTGSALSRVYSRMVRIEGQALQSENNGPLACSGAQIEFVKPTPKKPANTAPGTKHRIETFDSCVFAPPGLPSIQDRFMAFL